MENHIVPMLVTVGYETIVLSITCALLFIFAIRLLVFLFQIRTLIQDRLILFMVPIGSLILAFGYFTLVVRELIYEININISAIYFDETLWCIYEFLYLAFLAFTNFILRGCLAKRLECLTSKNE